MPRNIEQFINIEGRPFESLTSHLIPELMNHDGNIVAIWAVIPFPYEYSPGTPEEIKQKLIAFKKDENTQFVFDGMWEGHTVGVIYQIHKMIDSIDIDPGNCHYATGALDVVDIYDKFCAKYNIQKRMKVYGVNAWEFNTAATFKNFEYTPSYNIKEKEKIFLCYNRINRAHRTALLGLLLDKNLVEHSFYSYYLHAYNDSDDIGSAMRRLKLVFEELEDTMSENTLHVIRNNIIPNIDKFPLVLSLRDRDDNANVVRMEDFKYSDNSYFSLVTESFYIPYKYGDDDADKEHAAMFFSEKIFKPITYKHPFILVTRPYALRYLRNMGYRTFSPIINEEYDEIENDEQRLLAIVDEVERLSKFSTSDWLEWQMQAKEIVEHNYNTLMNKKQFIATGGKWYGEFVYARG